MAGLSVRVSFTGTAVTKSLRSLSGGQKAVVALLFILALQEPTFNSIIYLISYFIISVAPVFWVREDLPPIRLFIPSRAGSRPKPSLNQVKQKKLGSRKISEGILFGMMNLATFM
jgi:hypothetical protein